MFVPTDCPAIPRRSASLPPGQAAPISASVIDIAPASASRRSGSSYGLLGITTNHPEVSTSAGTVLKTPAATYIVEPSALDSISPDHHSLVRANSSVSALPHDQLRRLALPTQTAADLSTNSTREAATSISFTNDGQRPPDAMPLSRRGQTLPASLIPHSDVSALHHPPHRSSSQLSAFHIIQQASSVSRRASLANLLHRMSTGTHPPSDTASTQLSDAASALSPAASSDCAHALDTVGRLLSSNVSSQLPPSRHPGQHAMVQQPQVASEHTPRVAAGSLPAAPNNSPLLSGTTVISVSLGGDPSLLIANDTLRASSSASQQACVRPLERTISDVALEALESVDSLKCPIIEYSHLDIRRKIGAGSIGQVCTLDSDQSQDMLAFCMINMPWKWCKFLQRLSLSTAYVLDSHQTSTTCMSLVCGLPAAHHSVLFSHHLNTCLLRPCTQPACNCLRIGIAAGVSGQMARDRRGCESHHTDAEAVTPARNPWPN